MESLAPTYGGGTITAIFLLVMPPLGVGVPRTQVSTGKSLHYEQVNHQRLPKHIQEVHVQYLTVSNF